ncbi:MAG: chaperonin GroEL, partial [Candidatus Colwellbacteria bacterium]|nr:chaperonin GroEL [Candidatus Colwellbacteria bacterium]
IENSGDNPDLVIEKILAEKAKNQNGWVGFNAATGEVGDLKAAGIVDPLKVTKTALMNAVSVAANYLTIGAAIIEVPKKEEKGGHGGHAHEEF